MTPTLHETEVWLAGAVMVRDAPGEDESSLHVKVTPRRSASVSLDVYRRGYLARLVECLEDDYRVLRYALGDAPFRALCEELISRHPPSGANLNSFGGHFERFCRDEAPAPFPLRDFAADLAALEWAIVEVIHAADDDPLTLDEVRAVPSEAWADSRLIPNHAVRLLRFEHPVNVYLQAFHDGRSPSIPAKKQSAAVVYRSGLTVWRMDLTPSMLGVLSAILGGESLGAALALGERAQTAAQESPQRVTEWFREWVTTGLFARVER
jgi:hypothetical protein